MNEFAADYAASLLDNWDIEWQEEQSKESGVDNRNDDGDSNWKRKVGSNLSQLSAENGVKPGCLTQSQAKRINEIAFSWLFREQGVGGDSVCGGVKGSV
jgi:hypothetical protein